MQKVTCWTMLVHLVGCLTDANSQANISFTPQVYMTIALSFNFTFKLAQFIPRLCTLRKRL